MRNAECVTRDGEPVVLKGLNAHGRVVGRMLDMTLEQTYLNPESRNVEVVYTFPLPHGAVLLGIEVVLNGETLRGTVKAKATAREKYEDALADGHTALLLTVQPDGAHTLELGNLLANETAVVKLQYVQVLSPEQGSLRLTLPTTLAPRYGDAVRQGGYAVHAVPETSATVEYPFDLVMRIEGELATARIGSPSHPIELQLLPADDACTAVKGSPVVQEVRLARSGWLDRDFILTFASLAQTSQGLAAWDRLDDGVGVVMAGFTPTWASPASRPVALKVLVDCSGSMNGDSIEAARRALHRVVDGLDTEDRFSLSRFGSHVEHRSKSLWKLSSRTRGAAHLWVKQLDADLGGTEIAIALTSTLSLSSRARADVLLVTDGEVYAVDDVIRAAKASGQRMFIVGIGSSPAEGLLRRLARETGGSCEFVAPGEAVEPAILRLYHRMRSQGVGGVRVQWPTGLESMSQTDCPVAVFEGDTFNVYARFSVLGPEDLTQPIRLWGTLQGQNNETCLAELSPHFISDDHNTLGRLAAHTRYTQLRQASDAPALRTTPLPALAEKYQLVTDDTSFVLVKQRAAGEQPADLPALRQVTHMLAAGWGGTGSVNTSRDSMSVPSVWRTHRPAISAPDHLPSKTVMFSRVADSPLLEDHDQDFELPAFLRKQVVDTGLRESKPVTARRKQPRRTPGNWLDGSQASDSEFMAYKGWTPAGYAEWLRFNADRWPTTYRGLRAAKVGELLVQWLELVVGERKDEATVVLAFNLVVADLGQSYLAALGDKLMAAIGGGRKSTPADTDPAVMDMARRIAAALSDITPQAWPQAVLRFEDEVDV